jgi:hypothetical protein
VLRQNPIRIQHFIWLHRLAPWKAQAPLHFSLDKRISCAPIASSKLLTVDATLLAHLISSHGIFAINILLLHDRKHGVCLGPRPSLCHYLRRTRHSHAGTLLLHLALQSPIRLRIAQLNGFSIYSRTSCSAELITKALRRSYCVCTHRDGMGSAFSLAKVVPVPHTGTFRIFQRALSLIDGYAHTSSRILSVTTQSTMSYHMRSGINRLKPS